MGWQDRASCIPAHLLGDKEARYTPRGIGRQHVNAKEDRFKSAQWERLHLAMRCWVREPFDGPWTQHKGFFGI